MKLGTFRTIADPDPDPAWCFRNVRVKGYVGEVERPTDQYVLRPVDHIFQEACVTMGNADALIVSAKAIDDYGSICFKFRYWGVPVR